MADDPANTFKAIRDRYAAAMAPLKSIRIGQRSPQDFLRQLEEVTLRKADELRRQIEQEGAPGRRKGSTAATASQVAELRKRIAEGEDDRSAAYQILERAGRKTGLKDAATYIIRRAKSGK
jgi:hypothetical protein